MSIAYWCILVAALLPYVWAFVAKRGPRYDNHDPRGWLAKQGDPHAHRANAAHLNAFRSEEHTSELQSLMRISYAVFCLKKKKSKQRNQTYTTHVNYQQIN